MMAPLMRDAVLLYMFMIAACTPPPPPDLDAMSGILEPLVRGSEKKRFTGSGEAVISVEGDVHVGNIDVITDGKGGVRAHFYGPLGIIVASVVADSAAGHVTFDNHTYAFTRDQAMDTLPFAWGRDLAFSELVFFLQGGLPLRFAAVMQRSPDSMDVRRNTINLLWQTDMLQIKAVLKRGTSILRSVMVGRSGEVPWTLKLGRFRKEMPYKVELKEDDRNYFLIKYEKIR